MIPSQSISVPVSSVPTHIVVWQESSNYTSPSSSSTSELVELRKRVEELEKMVRSLTQPRYRTVSDILSGRRLSSSEVSSIEQDQHDAPHQSPYFTATRVSEPVGLSVMTTPLHTAITAPHVPELKIFEELVEAASAKKDKTVTLNGVSFVCHTWNGETIYCEEYTGRAYIDPKDAFNNPDEHSIGYWDASKGRLQQKEAEPEVEEEVNELAEEVEVEEEQVEEEEEQQEEEQVEEEQQEEEQDEEEQEEEEQEEEEQAMELEEIEYKGKTYYKDAQNQVYQMDDNGDLDDTPIGVWNEQKQKVLKYSK